MRLLLAACLLLAGCAAPPPSNRVRIATAGAGLQTYSMPITLAETLGFYREEGVDVVLENLPTTVKALQALLGGTADVAGSIYQQTLQMVAEGQRLRAFFIMNHKDSKVLIVAPAARDRIRRLDDLKAALEAGRIHAAGLAGGDHFRLLHRHPGLLILADTSSPAGMRESYGANGFAGGTLSASQDWLTANSDTARRLTRALLRTHQWIASHSPEEILAKLPPGLHSADPDADVQILRWCRDAYTPDGALPPGAHQAMQQIIDATLPNVQASRIDQSAVWTSEYLPNSK